MAQECLFPQNIFDLIAKDEDEKDLTNFNIQQSLYRAMHQAAYIQASSTKPQDLPNKVSILQTLKT